jgi:hypothetical protein
VELMDSHVISKWAYRRARDAGAKKPDPVFITDRKAVQTSRQLRDYLLCSSCEQRFSIAERFVSLVTYQADGTAALKEMLGTTIDTGRIRAAEFTGTEEDAQRICYFGASLLWRSHVFERTPECRLGPYAEPLRGYLNGEATLPKTIAVAVGFYDDADAMRTGAARSFTVPKTTRLEEGHAHLHRFLICGLEYRFAVGRRPPDHYVRRCFAHSEPKLILLLPSVEAIMFLGPAVRRATRKIRK